ncbi:pantothenate kinase [Thermoplasmatales archaeon]|nr:pantothenate kinase [Thermoplasmatales archaeon]
MIDPHENRLRSPYLAFNRKQWAEKKGNLSVSVSDEEIAAVKSLNDRIARDEVEDFYFPISRLIDLYITASLKLHEVRNEFLSENGTKVPYIVGVTGSVAVGKSTTSRILKLLLERLPWKPKVDLVTTDNFLYPNRILEEKGIMNRKGFPESYDIRKLINFLSSVKSGEPAMSVPVYSHLEYDILSNQSLKVEKPDVLIIEGLNILQIGDGINHGMPKPVYVSDFIDFSIFVDAPEEWIREWFIERFLLLKENAFVNPKSYFKKYRDLSREDAVNISSRIWDEINGLNYRENIMGTKWRAHLILEKGRDHSIQQILMRKI